MTRPFTSPCTPPPVPLLHASGVERTNVSHVCERSYAPCLWGHPLCACGGGLWCRARYRLGACPVVVVPCPQFVAINWVTVFRSCFLVMFLAYPGVSIKVLRVFKCRGIDGMSYLEADMRLQVGTKPLPGLMGAAGHVAHWIVGSDCVCFSALCLCVCVCWN